MPTFGSFNSYNPTTLSDLSSTTYPQQPQVLPTGQLDLNTLPSNPRFGDSTPSSYQSLPSRPTGATGFGNSTPSTGGGSGASGSSNYAPLDFNNPSRYLYVNGKMEDRTDPNSNYYLSQWMYPNMSQGIQQMNVPYGAMNDSPNQITPGGAPNYGASGNVPQPVYGGTLQQGQGQPQYGQSQPQYEQTPQQPQGGNNQFMQLLQYLFGNQASQPQYHSVRTPLGYTQYQGSVPQSSHGGIDPMMQLILQMIMGQNGQGGTQGSFASLLQ